MTPSDLREKRAAMTPGEWRVQACFVDVETPRRLVCDTETYDPLSQRSVDEDDANARGIAATHNVAGLLIDLWEAVKWQGCPTAVTACEHPVCIALAALSRVEVDRGC